MKDSNRMALKFAIALLVILAVLLAGCGSKPDSTASNVTGKSEDKPSSKPTNEAARKSESEGAGKSADKAANKDVSEATVKVALLQGSQAFPIEVMEQKGIAAKYKLKIEKQMKAEPQALYTVMKTPDFQISVGGWATIALLREQGYKLTNVYPFLGYTNDILVLKGSPLKSYADLKGKRIGLFGGPSAGTSVLFRMEGIRFFDFDPQKQAQVKFGAPPLLAGMLDRGELDAVLLLEPVSTQLMESGKYRSIGNIGTIWREKTGEDPLFLTVVANETWAKANPDVLKRFLSAYKESIDILKNQKDVWPALAKSVGIKTAEGTNLIRENFISILFTEWDQKLADQQYKSFAEMKKLFPEIEGYPKSIPDGTFSLQYSP